ncbi:autotransporter outer membrane beta-barrel domain-containing protein [Avibacterium paragallinarum]|nr:autotransporter outer membrane beta-barrel domain-containing protein [Avibacterium paragallinarum]UXN34035.1 autotransporter outer membrane beta-barrel domain-containing protein [Avibacterium paragallinarum]
MAEDTGHYGYDTSEPAPPPPPEPPVHVPVHDPDHDHVDPGPKPTETPKTEETSDISTTVSTGKKNDKKDEETDDKTNISDTDDHTVDNNIDENKDTDKKDEKTDDKTNISDIDKKVIDKDIGKNSPVAVSPSIDKHNLSPVVLMSQINLAQGLDGIRTLNERRGVYQGLEGISSQTWGRLLNHAMFTQTSDKLGELTMRNYGVQLGKDKVVKNAGGEYSLTGIFGGYSRATSHLDYAASHNTTVGKLISHHFHLGIAHTHYGKNGNYLDLVGQLSYFRNQYFSNLNDTRVVNPALGLMVSAEIGKALRFYSSGQDKNYWVLEPQSQLIYQFLSLKNIKLDNTEITFPKVHRLLGRVGVRGAYNIMSNRGQREQKTIYATANIWHDFKHQYTAYVNNLPINSRYVTTWWDAGIGIQFPLKANIVFYADIRYEQAFGKRERFYGYRGTLGIKYNLPSPKSVTTTFKLNTDALFAFNKSTLPDLLPKERDKIDNILMKIEHSHIKHIALIGHTDRLGSQQYNKQLGLKRAESIANYLKAQGLNKNMTVTSQGEDNPITTHCKGHKATKALIHCLQPDRRVEIILSGENIRP